MFLSLPTAGCPLPTAMEIRPFTESDMEQVGEIDGTVESTRYLHLERTGDGLMAAWRLEERPLRDKLIEPNRLSEDLTFDLRQVVRGIEEGLVLAADHEGFLVGMLLAKAAPENQTLRLLDLRIDFENRRQGLATAMVYQTINRAREMGLRALAAETRTNNLPASQLLFRCGFELAGLDTHRHSNHDLVKESATLLWYAALD